MTIPTKETLAVLDQLSMLVTATRTYGSQHPATEGAAANLASAIRAAAPPFAFQFVVGAVFRDRELLPIDGERYDRVLVMAEGLHRGGAQEITFQAASTEDLVLLASMLQANPTGRLLDDLGLASISFREIPDAKPGEELETVEPEIFVAAQLVLGFRAARACADAAANAAGVAWPFAQGMEAVRRLERAMETHASVTAYTLEIAPGAMDPGRRALMAAHHVRVVTTCLSIGKPLARAAAHAALAIAACGLTGRGGAEFEMAVGAAAARSADALDAASADPHRILVSALLHDQATHRRLSIGELLRLAYELECARCPADVAFDLGLADVLATALSRWNQPGAPTGPWVRVRVAAAGVMPAGARVRLADGRRGIILGPGASGDPMRPMILIDGRTIEAAEPPVLDGTPHQAAVQAAVSPTESRALKTGEPSVAVAELTRATTELAVAPTPALTAAPPELPGAKRELAVARAERSPGTRVHRDSRRDSTGPRVAPVPKEALVLLERDSEVNPAESKPTSRKPLRREDP